MGRVAVRPALRLMTVVLSNGATLRMPTAAVRTKPYIASQVRRGGRSPRGHCSLARAGVSLVACRAPHPNALARPPAHALAPAQDLFQHNVWAVKTKGAEAAAASRMRQVDFSDFYKKFGVQEQ